jgi:hypothetical protein
MQKVRQIILTITIICAGVLVFVHLSMPFIPDVQFFEIITDDGYYALTVARNIGIGSGVTIDGQHLTNGFQPLWVFLTAPVYWFFPPVERVEPLRVIVAFQAVLLIFTSLISGRVLYKVVGKKFGLLAFWLPPVLLLSNYMMFRLTYNGLETILVLLLIAVLWGYFQTSELLNVRGSIITGVLFGLAILARIDAVFLLTAYTIVCLIMLHGQSDLKYSIRHILIVGCAAALISLPWWMYNAIQFGSLMPTSGSAQQAWSFDLNRVYQIAHAWLGNLVPLAILPAGAQFSGMTLLRVALFLAGVAGLFVLYGRKIIHPGSVDKITSRTLWFGLVLVLYVFALTAWYASSSFAVWHYPRYLAPVFLLFALVASILTLHLLQRWALPTIFILAALCLTVPIGRLELQYFSDSTLPAFGKQLELVNQYTAPQTQVAAGQSGTLGYFRDNVINLDGKVNAAVLAHHPWNRHESTVWMYLNRQQVNYVCDIASLVEIYIANDPEHERWTLVASNGDFQLYYRQP